MVAKAKAAKPRFTPTNEPLTVTQETTHMPDANVDHAVRENAVHEHGPAARTPAPEGMTYNRKGVLVTRRKQSPRSNKVFVVMQVVNEDGEPALNITKRNIRVLRTERNSDKVLELIDSGEYDGAFYLRLDLAAK
jgi:hypothetical protein